MSPIHNPAALRQQALHYFEQAVIGLAEGEQTSHLAYRTTGPAELARMLDLARCFGNVITDEKPERVYHWVVLNKPLQLETNPKQKIYALEFPAPRPDETRESGFYACVGLQPLTGKHAIGKIQEVTLPSGVMLRLLHKLPDVLVPLAKVA